MTINNKTLSTLQPLKKISQWSILCGLVFSLHLSCGTDEFAEAAKNKVRVDTLTNNQIVAIGPILDSLCLSKRDSMVRLAVDSIMPIRIREIEEMLAN
ncbi:MAG: hypothetical protein AB8G15_00320 [Saprospiraceae bacterium]